jgi:hypothetical protein
MRHDGKEEMTLRAGLSPMSARRETKAANFVRIVIPSCSACEVAPDAVQPQKGLGDEHRANRLNNDG